MSFAPRQLRLFAPPPTPLSPYTLMQLVELYALRNPKLGALAADQLRVTVRLFNRFAATFDGRQPGPVLVCELSDDFVLAFLRWLSEPHPAPSKRKPDRTEFSAPATVNQKRSHVMTLWRFALKRSRQPDCPFPEIERPFDLPRYLEPDRDPTAWDMPEMERLFRSILATKGRWPITTPTGSTPAWLPVAEAWLVAALVVWDTGLRRRALLAARIDRIDFDEQTLFVPAEDLKGKRKDRTFALHEQTCRAIEASLLHGPRERIFPSPHRERSISKNWKAIVARAGLPTGRKFGLHCLRRSTESHAAAAAGIEFAAAAIGHTVAVAAKSYVSEKICRPKAVLIDVIPRPIDLAALPGSPAPS